MLGITLFGFFIGAVVLVGLVSIIYIAALANGMSR